MGSYIEVVPAYGRDYKNKAEVIADLIGKKDFKLTTTGQYIGLDEMIANDFSVIVRYGKLLKVTDVTKDIAKYKKNRDNQGPKHVK